MPSRQLCRNTVPRHVTEIDDSTARIGGVRPAVPQVASGRGNLIGAALMVASVMCFTGLDTTLKVLVADNDFWLLAWARNLAQVVLLTALLPVLGARKALTVNRPWLQVARGFCLAASTVAIMLSLKNMTLTQTYVAMLSAPLVAAALAGPIVGEPAGRMQWLWIVAGFVGVVVALDPAAPEIGSYLLYAAAMAVALGTNHCLTRLGARTEGPYTQLFFIAAFALLFLTPILTLATKPLPMAAWGWVLLAGAFGTAAHFLMILALGHAPPSIVSPMLYTQVVWAAVVGWIVFREWPTMGTVAGALIVVVSGILLLRAKS